MSDPKTAPMSYEFSDEDEAVILAVGNLGVLLAVLLMVIGSLAYIDAIFDEVNGINFVFALVKGFILLAIGLMFISPAMAFRRVANTEGRDIEEMIGGLDVFGKYLYVTIILVAITLVIGITEAFL